MLYGEKKYLLTLCNHVKKSLCRHLSPRAPHRAQLVLCQPNEDSKVMVVQHLKIFKTLNVYH